MKKIGIIVNFGPEIRPFFESNLINFLSYKADCFYLIKETSLFNKLNIDILKKSVTYNSLKISNFKASFIYKLFLKFDSLFYSQRKARQRRLNFGNYHFTTGSSYHIRKSDRVFGSEIIYNLLRMFYNIFSKYFFYSKYLSKILNNNKITDILYYGSNMYEMKHFIHTAKTNKIRLYHYVGNWKDIYIDDFVPVQPTKLYVWSKKMKDDLLLFNKHIDEKSIIVSGNLFYNRYLNYKPFNDLSYYRNAYNIKENSNIYLWPLSINIIFPNEHILIRKVDDFIENNFKTNKPTIIIRDNPFGELINHLPFYSKLKNVRVARNYWYQSKNDDFTFQASEGELEWGDLLYFSNAIFTIPSTVSLESILFDKICINILFDENGVSSERISSLSSSPFYSDLLERNDVKMADNLDRFYELFTKLNDLIINDKIKNHYPEILNGTINFDLKKFIETLVK